jgi:hypothetical protein
MDRATIEDAASVALTVREPLVEYDPVIMDLLQQVLKLGLKVSENEMVDSDTTRHLVEYYRVTENHPLPEDRLVYASQYKTLFYALLRNGNHLNTHGIALYMDKDDSIRLNKSQVDYFLNSASSSKRIFLSKRCRNYIRVLVCLLFAALVAIVVWLFVGATKSKAKSGSQPQDGNTTVASKNVAI